MLSQRTIAKKVSITGIGIHSGKKVTMNLFPAEADTGIRFKRVDLPNSEILTASATTVGATENNTTLGSGTNAVHTVEHLLSVLYGIGIDNVYVEIDGPEVPIMDGSGASFVFVLKEIGIHRVWAITSQENTASISALKKMNFQNEGVLNDYYLIKKEKFTKHNYKNPAILSLILN